MTTIEEVRRDFADDAQVAISVRQMCAQLKQVETIEVDVRIQDYEPDTRRVDESRRRSAIAFAVDRKPFFACTQTQDRRYFFVEERTGLGLDGEIGGRKWTLVGYSSPHFAELVDAAPLATAVVRVPRGDLHHTVACSARFHFQGSRVSRGVYRTKDGVFRVETGHEHAPEVVRVGDSTQANEIEQLGAENDGTTPSLGGSGLLPVVARSSAEQRRAMHASGSRYAAIYGPPGAGKTTVGLMRLAVLIDGESESDSSQRHIPETSVVVSDAPDFDGYLRAFRESERLESIRVVTMNELLYRRIGSKIVGVGRSKLPDIAGSTAGSFYGRALAALKHVCAHEQSSLMDWQVPNLVANPAARELIDPPIKQWFRDVSRATVEQSRLPTVLDLRSIEDDCLARLGRQVAASRTQPRLKKRAEEAREAARTFFDSFAERLIALLTQEWKRECSIKSSIQPSRSHADRCLYWLCSFVFPPSPSERIRQPRQVLIDEAQDYSPFDLVTLERSIFPGAAVTLALDPDQNLSPDGGMAALSELPFEEVNFLPIATNHRQSEAVGRVVHRFYHRAWNTVPYWTPGTSVAGGEVMSVLALPTAKLIADGVMRLIRGRAGPARLAVLALASEVLAECRLFASEVADFCKSAGYPCRWMNGNGNSDVGSETSVLHVLSVEEAKGREFDFVILACRDFPTESGLIGPGRAGSLDHRRTYVALSRALHGLIVLSPTGTDGVMTDQDSI